MPSRATTAKRTDTLPDTPAIGEFVQGYEAVGWYGVTAPAGTPADIVAKLAAAIVAAGGDATFKSRLVALGVELAPMTTPQFKQFVANEIDKWAKVVKFASLKADSSMADPSTAPAAAADEIPPDTDPAIRTIAMPADTNPHGDIFGGWLLCQMDLAGATVARATPAAVR